MAINFSLSLHCLKRMKKYTASLLLVVFAWVMTPGWAVHELFADHHDTECTADHSWNGSQIESVHTHCDIFWANAPVYSAPELVQFSKVILVKLAELSTAFHLKDSYALRPATPARGPPLS